MSALVACPAYAWDQVLPWRVSGEIPLHCSDCPILALPVCSRIVLQVVHGSSRQLRASEIPRGCALLKPAGAYPWSPRQKLASARPTSGLASDSCGSARDPCDPPFSVMPAPPRKWVG